jgi:UDP-N-acetylmuramate dehydrogenase
MKLPFPHLEQKMLSDVCSFGIGGPAKYFATASSIEEMQQILKWAFSAGEEVFILGKGSNCLFDDRGFNGLVILNKIDTIQQDENIFTVGGGYGFARLGGQTARLGFGGLEFASGIPATVGGAIYMNAGANGAQTADCLDCVLFVTAEGDLTSFKKEELHFDYRTSSFQKMKGAIVQGIFVLTSQVEAKEKQKKLLEYRLQTQPYKDKSAGCVFRNPEGCSSAGRLIDECGLKGINVGGAQVSPMHANFLINANGATAADILGLIELIKERVYREKGIKLEEEIRYIPYRHE